MLALLFIASTGCENNGGQKATDFGVSDPTMSALVIQDKSDLFFITAVNYITTESGTSGQQGAIADNKSATYTIKPGSYTLVVEARWENPSTNSTTADLLTTNTLKFADEKLSDSFTVQAGDAVVYNLNGGAIFESLGKYTAPTLELQ